MPWADVTNIPDTVKEPKCAVEYSVCIFGPKRNQWAPDAAQKHSISTRPLCPLCREISSGCSRAQCVNPVMSKLFHYCSWQIWQLLSSNTELQLHLKGVWIETDYSGSDSELSLLSPQCNLPRFSGAALNGGSARTDPESRWSKCPGINRCPTTRGGVLWLSAWNWKQLNEK